MSQTRVERIDLSTKWLNTQKRTPDKRIFVSFYFYEIKEMRTKTKEFELFDSSYLVCDPFSAILVYIVRCRIECLLNDLGFWEPAEGGGF